KILEKMTAGPSQEELAQLTKYFSAHPEVLLKTKTELPSAVYALAWHPQGTVIAAAGGDGRIRTINPVNGALLGAFLPIDVTGESGAGRTQATELQPLHRDKLPGKESLPSGAVVAALDVSPPSVVLPGPYGSVQLLVAGILRSGDRVDLTRLAHFQVP